MHSVRRPPPVWLRSVSLRYSRARTPPRRGRPGRGAPGPLSVPGAPGSGDRVGPAPGSRVGRPRVNGRVAQSPPPPGHARTRGAPSGTVSPGLKFGPRKRTLWVAPLRGLVTVLLYATQLPRLPRRIMRRRSHRACHYYVERRRTAGPTSMLCIASPGVAVLLSLSLSLARARALSLSSQIGGSPHSLALLSLALSSLSLSLFGAGSIPSHEMSIHARSLLASFAPHTLGGGPHGHLYDLSSRDSRRSRSWSSGTSSSISSQLARASTPKC